MNRPIDWHYVYSSLLQQYLQLKNTASSYFLRLVVNAVGPKYPSLLVLNYEMWCVMCATRTSEQH